MTKKRDGVLISLIIVLAVVSAYWIYKPATGLRCWSLLDCVF